MINPLVVTIKVCPDPEVSAIVKTIESIDIVLIGFSVFFAIDLGKIE